MSLIQSNYNLLFNSEEVHEVRILNTPQGVISGYFNDPVQIAQAIKKYDGQYNIFMTLNPVKGLKDGVELNKLYSRVKKVTKDNDISRIAYLFIDIDPEREHNTSSTDEEFQHAVNISNNIESFLFDNGFGVCHKMISGNGIHLLYKFAPDTNIEVSQLNGRVLKILDKIFSNQLAKVDVTTYNASRLTKLYGTKSCKGPDTEKRPHRTSNVFVEADSSQMVELVPKILEDFIQKYEISTDVVSVSDKDPINLKYFLNQHGYKIKSQDDYHGVGTIYKFYQCPFNPEHQDNSAYAIQFHTGAIMVGCHHNSCSKYGWKYLYNKHNGNVAIYQQQEDTKMSMADEMVHMVLNNFDLCINQTSESFVIMDNNGVKSSIRVKSSEFKKYLRCYYFRKTRKSPSLEAIKQAIDMIEAECEFSGNRKNLDIRVNQYENNFFYDLGSDDWKSVRVSEGNCEVIEQTPAIFYRNNLMKPQVTPNLNVDTAIFLPLLKKHFRFKSEDDLWLYAIYIISSLVPNISHPILLIHGEKGSSKSTTMRLTRELIDPNEIPVTTLPKNKDDLAINFSKNYMPSFDNLTTFSREMSDLLCMGVTGGAITKRTLYSDTDETVISFKRTIMMNGISVVATQPDLLDRCLLLELMRIPQTEYKTEDEVFNQFNSDKADMLGAMFQVLAKAKALYKDLKLTKVFRLADFTFWGYAIAEELGLGGDGFIKILQSKQQNATLEAIDSNIVASLLLMMMRDRGEYRSSIAQLLEALRNTALQNGVNITTRNFPTLPRVLSVRLKEIKSNLEEIGITYSIKNIGTFKEITILNSNVNNSLNNKNNSFSSSLPEWIIEGEVDDV